MVILVGGAGEGGSAALTRAAGPVFDERAATSCRGLRELLGLDRAERLAVEVDCPDGISTIRIGVSDDGAIAYPAVGLKR